MQIIVCHFVVLLQKRPSSHILQVDSVISMTLAFRHSRNDRISIYSGPELPLYSPVIRCQIQSGVSIILEYEGTLQQCLIEMCPGVSRDDYFVRSTTLHLATSQKNCLVKNQKTTPPEPVPTNAIRGKRLSPCAPSSNDTEAGQ